jgi:glycerol-3-phosphate dehydrogenase
VTAFDVVVIGGGVLGCAIAARLAATTARVCLLEASADVGNQASKGNAGVAVSYYGAPGTLETDLICASNPRWEDLCARLDVPYRRCGAVMIALDDLEAAALDAVVVEARACGIRAELVDGARARRIEPMITSAAIAAVHLPDEGIIDPMRLTVAFARLAAANGCDVRRSSPATAIDGDGPFRITTPNGVVTACFLVNAAGVAAGRVSELAGGEALGMYPRKGQYLVLDRGLGTRMRSIVFSTHLADTKGTNVIPTTHGTCLLGPTATDHDDPADRATDGVTLAAVRAAAARLVPAVATATAVKSFAANRPAASERTRLRIDPDVPTLLHATNRSTGVSAAPATADRALALLRDAGLVAADRAGSVAALPAVPSLRTSAEPERLTAIDPAYGQVVCVCEQVSAAEIRAALAGPVGARSVDALRRRTGAGYGRCQGALCMAGLTFLTAMAAGTGPAETRLTACGSVSA